MYRFLPDFSRLPAPPAACLPTSLPGSPLPAATLVLPAPTSPPLFAACCLTGFHAPAAAVPAPFCLVRYVPTILLVLAGHRTCHLAASPMPLGGTPLPPQRRLASHTYFIALLAAPRGRRQRAAARDAARNAYGRRRAGWAEHSVTGGLRSPYARRYSARTCCLCGLRRAASCRCAGSARFAFCLPLPLTLCYYLPAAPPLPLLTLVCRLPFYLPTLACSARSFYLLPRLPLATAHLAPARLVHRCTPRSLLPAYHRAPAPAALRIVATRCLLRLTPASYAPSDCAADKRTAATRAAGTRRISSS